MQNLESTGLGGLTSRAPQPLLSIVIPTHNRSNLLRICLNSLARHAPQATEIIVVDDGSRDASGTTVAGNYPGVKSIRSSRPRGFCAAANAGINIARGVVIEMLNDDTEVTADWAESALAWFDDHTVASVAPLVLRTCSSKHSPPEIDSAGDHYYLGGVAGKRGHGQPLAPDYLRPCRVFGASASSAFFRRDVLVRLGAFPESFGAYFEDVDLAFRLNRAGYQVIYEPCSRVHHRGGGSYGAPRRRLLEQQSRNEERVFWRNTPQGAWREAIPHHLAVLAGKTLRRWQEGQLVPFICGRLRLLGEIGTVTRYRRHLNQLGPAMEPMAWEVETRFWG